MGQNEDWAPVLSDIATDYREGIEEAVAIMRDARGHYGIEECGGPGQPATEWDEIADWMQSFVSRWGQSETS